MRHYTKIVISVSDGDLVFHVIDSDVEPLDAWAMTVKSW